MTVVLDPNVIVAALVAKGLCHEVEVRALGSSTMVTSPALLDELEMNTTPRLLDVVALLADLPSHGLRRGHVGTVVEMPGGACEVEFSDDEGRAYAQAALAPEQLLVPHHRPTQAA